MEKKEFEVKLIKGNSRLEEIREVRKRAWESSDNADLIRNPDFLSYINNDEDDDVHFIIEDGNRITAVARIRLKNDFEQLSVFENFNLPMDRTYAELERLGTDPDYRGMGLARLIDETVLAYIKNLDIPFLFVTVIPPRDKTLDRLGYRRLGIISFPNEVKEHLLVAYVYDLT
jgi:GNAT superfamily N-acetyltransferase